MERKYPHLFSPLQVGGVTFRNRIASAPMAYPDISPEGYLTPEAAAFYELRAQGGAALVTVSEGIVDTGTGRSYNLMIAMDGADVLPGLAMTAAAIKRHGAVPSLEINHGGMFTGADSGYTTGQDKLRYGPSETILANGAHIHEMPKEMIRYLVEKFGSAAAIAKKAGFEMILLHAGHGWLTQQFFSPADNHRTDEYGGSLINRARLTIEVLEAIRGAVGPKFPIEIRLSSDEYRENGYGIEDIIELAKLIDNKVDLIHLSTGSHSGSFDKTHQPMFVPRGGLVKFAAAVKPHVKTPVATIGAISDPAMAEEIIASGKADVVEMARQLLADPFWPKKVMTNREDEIVRCCRCFTCMGERMKTGRRICALNPIIGNEYEEKFARLASEPKKVMVAGGGPGGMQAAISAAKRGHKVVLCEKNAELGGALRSERAIPFKQDLFAFVKSKEIEMRKAGVEVRMSTEVTPEYVEKEAPDVLIVAVGAKPIIPPIPGIDGPNVVVANDLSDKGDKIGDRVVVLGGGLVGCEASIHLAQEGKQVTVIEMLPDVANDANGRHRPILMDMLHKLVTIRTGLRGTKVTAEGLYCADKDGNEEFFPADTVVCSVGQRPLRDVADSLRDSALEVIEVGDCVRPQTVTQAVSRGYFAAYDI
ncbi:MAG: FAD-dependent oxidoreductase [Oscillospiraceae bacterium]|nr:FAD-dependent oxidoreductase [Oscillospiraceae bacterium]